MDLEFARFLFYAKRYHITENILYISAKTFKKANDKITLQINVRKSIDYFDGKRYNI
ncbi:conserved hypothetical protein [Listeria marthii FSL S4-120]|uniref:Uncharacterized protein n=1 Tax=Listeria marthii FSL S4-120 TaxID=702457 RepID=A0ABP2K2A0_9LIST|nr:conserved hypothetical protein [Listeria marthii FSL S4-120]